MAVREHLMVKNFEGTNVGELRAKAGESLLIKGIYVQGVADGWLTAKIEKTTVGYFRVGDSYVNHLHFPNAARNKVKNLLDYLGEKGIFVGYPVGEGETFSFTVSGGLPSRVTIKYVIGDAGDYNPDDENGSKSKTYFVINYGDTGGDITYTGDFLYKRSLNPVEFPAFPFGADVPAKTRITLYGVTGSEVGVVQYFPEAGYYPAIYTQYLKFVKERIVMFDEDRRGFPFDYSNVQGQAGTYWAGGFSLIGNYDFNDPREPLMFPEPLVFDAGEELNIYVTVESPATNARIETDYQVLGLIMRIERTE